MAGTEKNEAEEDSMDDAAGKRGNEGRSDRRRGKKLADQETTELGAASMKGRRRRRGGGNYVVDLACIDIVFLPKNFCLEKLCSKAPNFIKRLFHTLARKNDTFLYVSVF